jgi:predicted kinase
MNIERERGAVRFSIDEHLKAPQFPEHRDIQFIMSMVANGKPEFIRILKEAQKPLAQGKDVVLDVATFNRASRDIIRMWAAEIGKPITLYYCLVDKNVRLARLRERNKGAGKAFSFKVPEWVFEIVEESFQPPTDDEMPVILTT